MFFSVLEICLSLQWEYTHNIWIYELNFSHVAMNLTSSSNQLLVLHVHLVKTHSFKNSEHGPVSVLPSMSAFLHWEKKKRCVPNREDFPPFILQFIFVAKWSHQHLCTWSSLSVHTFRFPGAGICNFSSRMRPVSLAVCLFGKAASWLHEIRT